MKSDEFAGDLRAESKSPPTELVATAVPSGVISAVTIAAYLIGRRRAIVDVACCPQGIAVGAVFVLSAGFAREYDGEDLLHEPWHLLIPFAASVITSFVLYCLMRIFAAGRAKNLPTFVRGFPNFLTLYWMTAPLAWLYAIPFERWMTPGEATIWNLRLLGIVSIWRVALIIRVIYVAWGARPLGSVIVLVLLFADAVMLAVLQFVPVPLLQFMGGVRLTESESILQGTTIMLQIIGFCGLFLLLLALFPVFGTSTRWDPTNPARAGRIHKSTWIVAICIFAAFGAVLPITQPEQQLRHQVERDLNSGRILQAIQRMSQHNPADFPPHWSPPPHIAMLNSAPALTDILSVIIAEPPAAWVRELFLEKLHRDLPAVLFPYRQMPGKDLSAYLVILDQLPLEEWFPPDDRGHDDLGEPLRQLADDKDRKLTEEGERCLQRIIAGLPSEKIDETSEKKAAE